MGNSTLIYHTSVHSVWSGTPISPQMQITKIIIHNSSQFIQFQQFFPQNNARGSDEL
jgi:hypothetical protein